MSFHSEILTDRQREALRLLGSIATERDFYLAGGTAIALHLGHRRSVDFDWFLSERMEDPLRLSTELQEEGIPFETGQIDRGTLYGSVHGVRVQDIAHLLYALAYFDDAEAEQMPDMLWKAEWKKIRETISDWVRNCSAP